MANFQTPKSTGELIGSVLEARGNTLRVRLNPGITLHNGDGLTIGTEGFSVNGIDGNLIRINKDLSRTPSPVPRTPSPLYRNLDVEFTRSLHSERRIPVDIVFSETTDGFELSYCSDCKCMIADFRFNHDPAKNEEKALETIRTQLAKLGDTPYIAREIRIESAPYFIPISILNEWRRQVINNL